MNAWLDAETRRALRLALDAHRRAKLAPILATERRCAGCNVPFDQSTTGCRSCHARHYNYRHGRRRLGATKATAWA